MYNCLAINNVEYLLNIFVYYSNRQIMIICLLIGGKNFGLEAFAHFSPSDQFFSTCEGCSYDLDISPLSGAWFTEMVSHSLCIFPFLLIFFKAWRFMFILMKFTRSVIYRLLDTFVLPWLWNHCPDQGQAGLQLSFFLKTFITLSC